MSICTAGTTRAAARSSSSDASSGSGAAAGGSGTAGCGAGESSSRLSVASTPQMTPADLLRPARRASTDTVGTMKLRNPAAGRVRRSTGARKHPNRRGARRDSHPKTCSASAKLPAWMSCSACCTCRFSAASSWAAAAGEVLRVTAQGGAPPRALLAGEVRGRAAGGATRGGATPAPAARIAELACMPAACDEDSRVLHDCTGFAFSPAQRRALAPERVAQAAREQSSGAALRWPAAGALASPQALRQMEVDSAGAAGPSVPPASAHGAVGKKSATGAPKKLVIKAFKGASQRRKGVAGSPALRSAHGAQSARCRCAARRVALFHAASARR